MRLNINTALITSKQKGNQNIAVISNYFWFDYSLKPYVSCIDARFTESEEQIRGRGAVYGYFTYSLLNIAHNHDIRPDTRYPTVLGENESEKPFSAIPVAKKGLTELFINILPSTVDGFAVSYRLVSDGQNVGFGVKDVLEVEGNTYKVYPNFLRVMKLPDEDLLIKRANFPVRVEIRSRKKGEKGGDVSVELPTLIDGLFSKTLNKHIGVIPERVLNSPRLEHLPQDWITWEDYRPVVCGQTLDTYELITPPDEDVLDFVNYLKSTYNKPVYLLVSVEFLLGSTITYPASVENVSQFINSLPVDGVVIQDDFSKGSWVAGTVNPAISTFLRNLYSQINKPKFYLPSYSTVRHVSFQNDTVSISESRNQLFNQTKHGCIYTPPLIPFKECGYTYGGYNANTCDHANYYLQKENKPVLKYEEFMQVYPSLTFINEPDKMYKPPNLLLSNLNKVVCKQHFYDEDIGIVGFYDIVCKYDIQEENREEDIGQEWQPLHYVFGDIEYEASSIKVRYGVKYLNTQTGETMIRDCQTVFGNVNVFNINDEDASMSSHDIIIFGNYVLGLYVYQKDIKNGVLIHESLQQLVPPLSNSVLLEGYEILNITHNIPHTSQDYNSLVVFTLRHLNSGRVFDFPLPIPDMFYGVIRWSPGLPFDQTSYDIVNYFAGNIAQYSFVFSGRKILNLVERIVRYFASSYSLANDYVQNLLHQSVFKVSIISSYNVELTHWSDGRQEYTALFNFGKGAQTSPYDVINYLSPTCDLQNDEIFVSLLDTPHGFSINIIPALIIGGGIVLTPQFQAWKFRYSSVAVKINSPKNAKEYRICEPQSMEIFRGWSPSFSWSEALNKASLYFNSSESLCDGEDETGSSGNIPDTPPIVFLKPAFYYQVFYLNHMATTLRNKTIFWNAFYLTPFWQIFTLKKTQDNQEQNSREQDNQDNTIAFYYTRIPYNFLAYFINIEADNEQINCCVNPRIVRDRPPNEEIGSNISIPQLPTNDTFTGGNEGQFPWLTPEQSSLLNPYNYVNSKLTTHKPFLIPLYEKFYRRVDKYAFLEPILAYVKGGQVSIIGQYKGIFAYTLPEHTDKVFLAVYRESANELILTVGEDLIMADVVEYEDVGLGILTSQENPFVFYKTHITKTGKVEEQDSPPIVRFVDLP